MEKALAIHRDLGNRYGEADALNEAGTLNRLRANPDQAQAYHRQALALARDIGSAWLEAHALADLSRCILIAGRPTDAQAHLRQAWEIFQRIGAAEASIIAAELDALIGAEAAVEESLSSAGIGPESGANIGDQHQTVCSQSADILVRDKRTDDLCVSIQATGSSGIAPDSVRCARSPRGLATLPGVSPSGSEAS